MVIRDFRKIIGLRRKREKEMRRRGGTWVGGCPVNGRERK